MGLMSRIAGLWRTRDELSPRNFRRALLPVILVLPLNILLGDLRFLDQGMVLLGIDANSLIMMVFGLGFLPMLFAPESRIGPMLKAATVAEAVLLLAQLLMGHGLPRMLVYLAFHAVNGLCTACGFYLFGFLLNNVERLFTVAACQVYFAITYLLRPWSPFPSGLRVVLAITVMAGAGLAAFRAKPLARDARDIPPSSPGPLESGVGAVIALNSIYYVITLMVMYIDYRETAASSTLYGAGGLLSIVLIAVVMLVFNYSALHLWSLCLICSVLGIGALHYAGGLAVGGGSMLYGLGSGLGFMVINYLLGGALRRSGGFRLFQLHCLFFCLTYVVVSGAVYLLWDGLGVAAVRLAFPIVLVLALVCFLFAPVLERRLFRTDWTDGYHMADVPALAEAEALPGVRALDLTPREMEVFTLLLTEASPKQIASQLKVSYATVNFHTKNLYRKLNIQSRTELFAQYGTAL